MTCHSTANPGRPRDDRGRYLKLPHAPPCETFNDNPGASEDMPHDGKRPGLFARVMVLSVFVGVIGSLIGCICGAVTAVATRF